MTNKQELIYMVVALRNKLQDIYYDLEDLHSYNYDDIDIPNHDDAAHLIKDADDLIKMTFLGF